LTGSVSAPNALMKKFLVGLAVQSNTGQEHRRALLRAICVRRWFCQQDYSQNNTVITLHKITKLYYTYMCKVCVEDMYIYIDMFDVVELHVPYSSNGYTTARVGPWSSHSWYTQGK